MLVCWWGRFDWSFARLLAPVVTTASIILSSSKIQNGELETFWSWLTRSILKMSIKMERERIVTSYDIARRAQCRLVVMYVDMQHHLSIAKFGVPGPCAKEYTCCYSSAVGSDSFPAWWYYQHCQTGINGSQWCEQDQVLKTKMTIPRPPEVKNLFGGSNFWVSKCHCWSPQ